MSCPRSLRVDRLRGMGSHYTQILARTDRPTQILGALPPKSSYAFPHTTMGTLICEGTSEAYDVRHLKQAAISVSWDLGQGRAVLAMAGEEEGPGFWCGLLDGGNFLFEHNRLMGPRNFEEKPANSSDAEVLSHYFPGTSAEDVYAALTSGHYQSALERHAVLAQSLRLPDWSVGIGYSRIIDGSVPPEAGTPKRPPESLKDLRPVPDWVFDIDRKAIDPEWYYLICERAFGFLKEEYGFQSDTPQRLKRPWNPHLAFYRNDHLTILVEGIAAGGSTRLCLIDRENYLLDLTGLVEHRDPELFDLCKLARGQREQMPIFAEALRKCAGDILAGDLKAISRIEEFGPGFSFNELYTSYDIDDFLAHHDLRLSLSSTHTEPEPEGADAQPRIVDADMLRDGGTTCVTLKHMGTVTHVTVDQRSRLFPWLPTPRFIFTSEKRMFRQDRRLLPWGRAEAYYATEIARAAVNHLGFQTVRDFLKGHKPNQDLDFWYYVLVFLSIVQRVRLRNVLSRVEQEG